MLIHNYKDIASHGVELHDSSQVPSQPHEPNTTLSETEIHQSHADHQTEVHHHTHEPVDEVSTEILMVSDGNTIVMVPILMVTDLQAYFE